MHQCRVSTNDGSFNWSHTSLPATGKEVIRQEPQLTCDACLLRCGDVHDHTTLQHLGQAHLQAT